jgi:hypothetical protein
MLLFSGLERAFGQYFVPPGTKADERGKVEGRAETWSKRPLELNDWEDHLAGKRGLGIVPITDASECRFGAIDIDKYPLDPIGIHEKCREHRIPLILCRSKSGGIHCYVFFGEAVPASLLRRKLMEWATLIGHPGVEVFPKQDAMSDVAIGNWINMPFYGGDTSLRYAYGEDGKAITMKEFLDHAERSKVDERWLQEWTKTKPKAEAPRPRFTDEDDWFEAPPCFETVLRENGGKIPGGCRNTCAFNFGIYLKKRYGNSVFPERVREYNDKYCEPPLKTDQIRSMNVSLGRRDYGYQCDKPPLEGACNRELCETRRYGVLAVNGKAAAEIEYGRLTMIHSDPPRFRLPVNGTVVEIVDLNSQKEFGRALLRAKVVFPGMRPAAFRDFIQKLLDECEEIHPDETARLIGLVRSYLREFCSTYRRAVHLMEDLHSGKPYRGEDGRTYFMWEAFVEHLNIRRFTLPLSQLTTMLIVDFGATWREEKIRGVKTVVWSVPSYPEATEPFTVPRRPPEKPM